MKKRIVSFLLILILTAGLLPAPARAAEGGGFLQGYAIKDGILTLDTAELPAGGRFQVTLDGQTVADASVQSVQEAELPVTVYCLVDISGSIYVNQFNMFKKVLNTINSKMGEGDNMVIGTLGDKLSFSEPLTTQEERASAIKALKLRQEDTNLYAGIVESLKAMNSSTNCHERRCLVVFSDGADALKTGYTRQEAESAILSARIPVYTVCVIQKTSSNAQVETSKKFGSLARISAGGAHFAPLAEEDTGAKAGKNIWDSLQGGLRIQADLNGMTFDMSKNKTLLRVAYSTGSETFEDTLEIYTEELPAPTEPPITETPTETGTEPPITTAATDPLPTEPELSSGLMLVIAGGILAAVIAAVLLIVLRKKKREEELRRKAQEEAARRAQEEAAMKAQEEAARRAQEEAARRAQEEAARIPRRKIQMIALRHEATQYSFELPEGIAKTMGKQADIVLNIQDPQLSRRHCEIKWQGDRMYIRDEGSLNGTFIHGVPIKGKGWMPLENHGILHAGTYDYRISFEEDLM